MLNSVDSNRGNGMNMEVPKLSAQDIERKSIEVLSKLNLGKILLAPQATPIEDIVTTVSNKFGVEFEIKDLPQGVLGQFSIQPYGIFIDSSIANTDRMPFTLAHEFGHFVLHRKVRMKQGEYVFSDLERHLLTGKKKLKTKRDWIEYQANRFASAILMPKRTIRQAVMNLQRELGIVHELGTIHLDHQPCNQRDAQLIISELTGIYRVNRTNVFYRLSDLGILKDHTLDSTGHISEFFLCLQ